MKLSEQWLRAWVNPPLSTKQLTEQMTLAGLDVAAVHPVAGSFNHVVVGIIVSAVSHPNASRLHVCEVDIGAKRSLQIVCGAKNCRVGLKVAVAQLGAHLPQNKSIKETTIRGIASQGMLCSSGELGLEDLSTDNGILELADDAPLGEAIYDYLQLNDYSLDIHLTPNRGDCLSVQGLARDISAITQQPMVTTPIAVQNAVINDKLTITVLAKAACAHYAGRIIRNINAQAKTPLWMQERLRRSGIRRIHPVVDVTNYVMLEFGQPLHAFDLKSIDGEVCVRYAKRGESVNLLDRKTVSLDPKSLVIADKSKILAMAGIMGSADSAVTSETQSIFLESAFFTPDSLLGRARYYGLSTDSAYRFERGVDKAMTLPALERATQLISEIVGGEVGPLTQVKSANKPIEPIKFHPTHLKKLLGFSLKEEKIKAIFSRLGIKVQSIGAQSWIVIPPSWRFDLSLEVDLLEELARIHGYQKIPATLPNSPLKFLAEPEAQLSRTRLHDVLIDRAYHEVINYSFTAAKLQKILSPQRETLNLVNPLSNELAVMRSSLWPGLLNTLRYNQQRQQSRVRLFETGLCFYYHKKDLVQKDYLAMVASGQNLPEQWGVANTPLDFFTVKSDLEALFSLSKKNIQFMPGTHSALHPGLSCNLQVDDVVMGYFGALHPKLITELHLMGPVFCFELEISAINERPLPQFKPYSKFPMVRRDISFWVDKKYPAQTILQSVNQNAGEYLYRSFFFDVYVNEQESVKHSLALALYWQHPTRTLIDTEVDSLVDAVIEDLKNNFTIQLRE